MRPSWSSQVKSYGICAVIGVGTQKSGTGTTEIVRFFNWCSVGVALVDCTPTILDTLQMLFTFHDSLFLQKTKLTSLILLFMRRSVGNHHRTKQRAIPSDQSSDQSDSNDNSDSNHPTPQIALGLPETNYKQLLTDIEEADGIDLFSFGKICNEKPEIYGRADSA